MVGRWRIWCGLDDWQRVVGSSSLAANVIGATRYAGLINAAILLGVAVFHVVGIMTGFTSEEITRLLTRSYAVAAGILIDKTYYLVLVVCGFTAILHYMVEWLYFGRSFSRIHTIAVFLLLAIGLFGSGIILPTLEKLHVAGQVATSAIDQQNFAKSFKLWRGLQWLCDGLLVCAALLHFCQLSSVLDGGRNPFSLRQVRS